MHFINSSVVKKAGKLKINLLQFYLFIYLFIYLSFLGPLLWHMEIPRLGGLIGAVAASLCQSHSSTESEPHLPPTPQLKAPPDP